MLATPTIFVLKGQAKKLQIQLSCKLHIAQKIIANNYGFKNWQTLSAIAGKTQGETNEPPINVHPMPSELKEYIDKIERSASKIEVENFKTSFILAMDSKDGGDFNYRDDFTKIYEEQFPLCEKYIIQDSWNWYVNEKKNEQEIVNINIENPFTLKLKKSFDLTDFLFSSLDLAFIRYKGQNQPKTFEEAYGLALERCFWHPMYVWINGIYINTWELPEIKIKGKVVKSSY